MTFLRKRNAIRFAVITSALLASSALAQTAPDPQHEHGSPQGSGETAVETTSVIDEIETPSAETIDAYSGRSPTATEPLRSPRISPEPRQVAPDVRRRSTVPEAQTGESGDIPLRRPYSEYGENDVEDEAQPGVLEEGDSRAIAEVLTNVLHSVLDNDFESTIDQFDPSDRDRMTPETTHALFDTDQPLTALKENWRNAYGDESITGQKIGYEARASGPSRAVVRLRSLEPQDASLAMVEIDGLIGRWKIDVGEALNGPTLQRRLQAAIEELAARQDWPEEPREGASLVAARVLSALLVQ